MNHHHNSVVGIFDTHTQAEEAVNELSKAGVNIKSISIVGRDQHSEEHVVGYYNTGERMMYWGAGGAFWGGLWGLLFGAGFFFVPGIGPLLIAGPLVAMLVSAVEGAVIVGGISALGAGLVSLGIPQDSVILYESAIRTGKYVLIFSGSADEVQKCREVLDRTNSLETYLHMNEPTAPLR